ncbi:MAG: phage holin family protein [Oscillospiraceae bacterium]|nr:phage holin family protein [Oscillospiraceae bacterium]
MLKSSICTMIGIIGAWIANLFGGWTGTLTTLIIFMVIDYLTGLAVAGFFQNSTKSDTGGLSSAVGFKGLIKKIMILAIVVVAYRLDLLINVNYIRNTAIIGFCANELISILENAGLMGLKRPTVLMKAIDILNSKQEDDHDDN